MHKKHSSIYHFDVAIIQFWYEIKFYFYFYLQAEQIKKIKNNLKWNDLSEDRNKQKIIIFYSSIFLLISKITVAAAAAAAKSTSSE